MRTCCIDLDINFRRQHPVPLEDTPHDITGAQMAQDGDMALAKARSNTEWMNEGGILGEVPVKRSPLLVGGPLAQ